MATKIRLRRRTNSALNTNVVLAAGEPYYNTTSKHLYIGNNDNDLVDVETKKHVAQITTLDESNSNNKIAFQIGEDPDNKFEQIVDNVSNATKAEQLVNWKSECTPTSISFSFGPNNEYGVTQQIGGEMSGSIDSARNLTESIQGKPIESILDIDNCSALKAHAATYTTENNTETIESRLDALDRKIDDISDVTSGAVSDTNATLAARIDKIVTGEQPVGKAYQSDSSNGADIANVATESKNLVNFKNESSGSTIKVSWGENSECGFAHTITGVVDSVSKDAANVTESIGGKAIGDIFETDGKTAKLATSATYASDDSKITIADRLAAVANSVNEYVAGTKISKIAKYTEEDQTNTIHTRIEAVRTALAELETAVGTLQTGASTSIAALNVAVDDILSGRSAVGDLENLRLTADGTTLTLSWGENKTSSATVSVDIGGSVDSAEKLTNSRKITLTGDVTGYTSFDGSQDVELTATVANNSHEHTIANITGLQTELNNKASTSGVYTKTEVTTLLSGKAESSHTHSEYAPANHTHAYASTTHSHDDKYYTEAEVDAKLEEKADASHTHSNYALTTHNHDSAYAPKDHTHEGIATLDHNHDSRYYTETETNTLLADKADANHTHSNYAPSGHTHTEYSVTTHNHDSEYAAKTHTHSELEWKTF